MEIDPKYRRMDILVINTEVLGQENTFKITIKKIDKTSEFRQKMTQFMIVLFSLLVSCLCFSAASHFWSSRSSRRSGVHPVDIARALKQEEERVAKLDAFMGTLEDAKFGEKIERKNEIETTECVVCMDSFIKGIVLK